MPKTAKNIWPQIVSFENLVAAWGNVRRGKRFSPVVLEYWANLEENLLGLQQALEDKGWSPAPWRQFAVQEPKPRLIQAPACGDRVVHHALMNVMVPIFSRRFRPESFACRTGMGTHAASRRTSADLRAASARWDRPYILKADISKYFQNINHDMLMHRLRRVVSDRRVLWLFETIIRKSGYETRGLPIGALTSQWLANLYLDPLDHFVKDDMDLPYYVRYMDDFVVIGPDKVWCHTALEQITAFLEGCLLLRLNPKTGIFPASHGINFVGYRHWTDHVLPRKSTVKRAKRTFKNFPALYAKGKIDLPYIRARVASFTGYMRHCNGRRTLDGILEKLVLTRGE